MTELQIRSRRGFALSSTALDSMGTGAAGPIVDLLNEAIQSLDQPLPSVQGQDVSSIRDATRSHLLARKSFDLKVLVSRVSMHFNDTRRRSLFRQIDMIHDPENWEESDELPSKDSFSTLMRFYISPRVIQNPKLGLSANGMFLAMWSTDGAMLTLEFKPKDQVAWIVREQSNGELEYASGASPLRRLWNVIAPYRISEWLSHGPQEHPTR